MWNKILDILKELLDIFGNWLRVREQDKVKTKVQEVSKKVDDSKIEELNKIWKDDLP